MKIKHFQTSKILRIFESFINEFNKNNILDISYSKRGEQNNVF